MPLHFREQNDEIDLMEDKLARVKAYYKLHRPGILDKPRSSKYDSTFIKSEKEGFWRCLLCTGDKYGLVKIEPTGSTSGRLTHLERHHPVELMQLKKGWTAKKNRRGRPGPLLDQIKLFVASRDSESGSIDDIEAENNSSMELASSSAIFPEGGAQPNDEIFAAREIKTEELPLEEPLTRFIPNFSDGGDASPNRIDHAITEFIARDMVPLGVVEGSGFAALMRVVQPNYEVKGMRYYSNRVLPQLYERMKERVKTALDSASAVAFSSDVRSDDTGNSFLSCTAHCIDPVKLKPTHFAIGIFPFKKDGRISSIIFHNIMDCLKEFGVERERRLIFVLDPASNITATRIMLDLPVINCYTNSIELSIRQGIEKMEAGLVIEKIKMIVHRIRNSPAQKNIALACFAECNLPPEDASVKWITLYNSVTRFLENRHAVRKFVHANQLPMASEKEERMPVLSDEEWNLLFKVQKLLAPFTAMTKYLQPRPLAHLSVIIPFYQVIKTRMEEAGEDELSDARRAILIDLRSRIWDYMGEGQQKIVCIATFLDPRFKDRFFKDFIYNPKEYFVNAVIETFVPAAQNEIKQEVDMKEHESEVEDEFKAFARAHAPKRPRRELPESDEFRSLIEQVCADYFT
ncbi:hypothetical protein WR25_27141 [Diploscapter pachys]|uniref:BED-type domain-containing protein n=1 Tax=Diploscapter pachys TaxID=2018661 RepID=A0A2A2LWV2_9BILA|nr:hypothetical protein WR25_27141 [Diploscapter pachys]